MPADDDADSDPEDTDPEDTGAEDSEDDDEYFVCANCPVNTYSANPGQAQLRVLLALAPWKDHPRAHRNRSVEVSQVSWK